MVKVITCIGIIIAVGFTTIALLPGPTRPIVSIRVVGYTNDLTGGQLAMVSVTNLGSVNILIYVPRVEVTSPAEAGGLACFGKASQWHSMLAAGASEGFTIPAPTNGSPWRLTFLVYNDFGMGQSMRRFLRGRRMPFDIQSGWIYNDK